MSIEFIVVISVVVFQFSLYLFLNRGRTFRFRKSNHLMDIQESIFGIDMKMDSLCQDVEYIKKDIQIKKIKELSKGLSKDQEIEVLNFQIDKDTDHNNLEQLIEFITQLKRNNNVIRN